MSELLLPWHEGFWEFYHSKPPVNWREKIADQGTIFLAPDPITGALNFISNPEEYFEREQETQEWIENSMIDPDADPFVNWYPFQEFDVVSNDENEIII